ncbi:MAG: hypothetical protein F4Z81_06375 [Gemmatimonadetes bacterium]|nr:hypothetical protein [Gemmatimonadota bacterium]MYB60221.1 hypothetical protein [Gemmatimonadota bacterium]
MDIKSLMSGIAVVIDDAYERDDEEHEDPIFQIVRNIENEWQIPFYKTASLPPENQYKNLLRSASFVLLDWKLWPSNAQELEREGIEANVAFLNKAKEYFVPVFIFTNETLEDVTNSIEEQSPGLYNEDDTEKNFIFVEKKSNLRQISDLVAISDWTTKNASVYTLKSWESAFYEAKRTLFSSMYDRSPNWPRAFWSAYEKDKVDPSSSLTLLINNNLLGRFKSDVFSAQILDSENPPVCREEIRSLMSEASFVKNQCLLETEVRSGDVFDLSDNKYLINIRPDCDCIVRKESDEIDQLELYCLMGHTMDDEVVANRFKNKPFVEKIWESVSFGIIDGSTVQFDFRQFQIMKYKDLKTNRIGRLIHPHITKMQQRFAFYQQRQGLPRIPQEAF